MKPNPIPPTRKVDPADEETALVLAAKRDPKAFGELYLIYINQVFRYLYSRLGDVQASEDAAAQTFLAAFEAFDKYRHDGHFAAWLFAIARRKATDSFRQNKNLRSLEALDPIPGDIDPLQTLIQTERKTLLAQSINRLPEEERELIRLRFIAGMSFSDIARLCGRKEDAVKKTLYRLLERLQSQNEVSHE